MKLAAARWARIGYSVPPLLMQAIAEHIRHDFFMKKPFAQ